MLILVKKYIIVCNVAGWLQNCISTFNSNFWCIFKLLHKQALETQILAILLSIKLLLSFFFCHTLTSIGRSKSETKCDFLEALCPLKKLKLSEPRPRKLILPLYPIIQHNISKPSRSRNFVVRCELPQILFTTQSTAHPLHRLSYKKRIVGMFICHWSWLCSF